MPTLASRRLVTAAARLARCVLPALAWIATAVTLPPVVAAQDVQRIGETSTWMFRAKSGVTLNSKMIRLSDVAEPVDPRLAAWNRLKGSVVGLIPVDRDRVTIRRDRLAAAVARAEASPVRIDWIGAQNIEVTYVATEKASVDPTAPTAIKAPAYPPETRTGNIDPTNSTLRRPDSSTPTASPPPVDPGVLSRLDTWIGMALNRDAPEIAERFEIRLANTPQNADAIRRLGRAGGIVHAGFEDSFASSIGSDEHPIAPERLSQAVYVTGRSVEGPIDATVHVALKPHPLAVAPKQSLRHGHRIGPTDLTLMPVPEDRWRDDYATDVDQFVGLEVTGSSRAGHPLSTRNVKRPLMIRRGDLIEVRVVGGGVAVTTNAKSLGDGYQSQLIEIETTEPRRRLVARVVSVGLVEIVTRAPVVR